MFFFLIMKIFLGQLYLVQVDWRVQAFRHCQPRDAIKIRGIHCVHHSLIYSPMQWWCNLDGQTQKQVAPPRLQKRDILRRVKRVKGPFTDKRNETLSRFAYFICVCNWPFVCRSHPYLLPHIVLGKQRIRPHRGFMFK